MHFLRLIRPVNLLIIGVTMYSTRMFLYVYEQVFRTELFAKKGEEIDFFLLVFSTVLIAAAGNIINDYFDVKADRINKPEKLIITKYIDRKWAILSHWCINCIAFGIAVYLSVRNNTFWYVFIHLLSINALWFYSMYFKRKPLIGNIIIAGLTALVPILCGVHFYVQHEFPVVHIWEINSDFAAWVFGLSEAYFIFILAFFAFTANLAREIVKDIEDIEGDKRLNATTLPILYGVRKSKWVAILVLLTSPLFFMFPLYDCFRFNLQKGINDLVIFIPVVIAILIELFAIFLLIKAQARQQYKNVDLCIKISMLLGIMLPFYWLLFFV